MRVDGVRAVSVCARERDRRGDGARLDPERALQSRKGLCAAAAAAAAGEGGGEGAGRAARSLARSLARRRSLPSATSLQFGDPGGAPASRGAGHCRGTFWRERESPRGGLGWRPGRRRRGAKPGCRRLPGPALPRAQGASGHLAAPPRHHGSHYPAKAKGGEEKLGTQASLAQLVTFAEIGPLPLPALPGGPTVAVLRGFWSPRLPRLHARHAVAARSPGAGAQGGCWAAPQLESVQTAQFSPGIQGFQHDCS